MSEMGFLMQRGSLSALLNRMQIFVKIKKFYEPESPIRAKEFVVFKSFRTATTFWIKSKSTK